MKALVYLVNIAVGVAIVGPLGIITGILGAWVGWKICSAIMKD